VHAAAQHAGQDDSFCAMCLFVFTLLFLVPNMPLCSYGTSTYKQQSMLTSLLLLLLLLLLPVFEARPYISPNPAGIHVVVL
jgi:hypothetical protein